MSDQPQDPKDQTLKRIQANNFWNTCPRKLDYLPNTPCEMGKCSANTRDESKQGCAWAINSEKDNFCFWRMIQNRSSKDGQMIPLFQGEIAQFLKCSPTKIHFLLKQAIENIQESNFLPALQRVLEGTEGFKEDAADAETSRIIHEIEEQAGLAEGIANADFASSDFAGRDYGDFE